MINDGEAARDRLFGQDDELLEAFDKVDIHIIRVKYWARGKAKNYKDRAHEHFEDLRATLDKTNGEVRGGAVARGHLGGRGASELRNARGVSIACKTDYENE